MLQRLFGKPPDPAEQARQWRLKLRQEDRALDRQIRAITVEEQKITRSVREAAKKNEPQVVRILATELVRSRKAKSRIYTTKAQINSVALQLEQTRAQVCDACVCLRMDSTVISRRLSRPSPTYLLP